MPSIVKRALRKLITPLLWDYSSAEYQCGRVSFSQFGEDVLCGFFFSRGYRGYHVDVGAFHPLLLSNTYDFYRKGWRGLCIDANPDMADLFARFRPNDKFIHSAVGAQAGSIEMALFSDGTFNCLAEHLADVPEQIRNTARRVTVPIQPLSAILAQHNIAQVDLLNVDCEGNDLKVLESNDWKRWRPKVICVEDHADNWTQSDIAQYLNSVGYVLKYRAVFTSIFIPENLARIHATSRGLEPLV
jgi:FkbM family methyltransferase